MKEEKLEKVERIQNLKNAPLTFRKIQIIDSESEKNHSTKFVQSNFHQTRKYKLIPIAKPISRIFKKNKFKE